MSEERKPVMCPCGNEMHFGCTERAAMCGEAPWAGMYICRCGWSSPYREGDTPIDCERNACLAATKRPPNLPLTREQVVAMQDDEAVWIYAKSRNLAWVHSAGYVKGFLLPCGGREEDIMFAAKPTPSEIDAARKEHA